MKRRINIIFVFYFTILIIYSPVALLADENAQTLTKIEVNASRSSLEANNIPSSISIITREEIERKKIPYVKDLLRESLGLDVIQSGPLGGLTSIFIHGNGSGATLVMVDGVQVNSNSAGAFNFAALPTDNIERIEIIRGPQSTLWGADAAGGVINIITRKGKGKPIHSLTFEGGSFATFKETLRSSSAVQNFDYSVTASRTDSQGFSSADEDFGSTEDDGLQNTNLSSRTGLNFLDDGRVDLIGNYSYSTNDFDFIGSDGPQFIVSKTYRISLPIQKSLTDWWDVKLNPSVYSHNSETLKTSSPSHIINKNYTVDLQNTFSMREYFSAILGGEYQRRTVNYLIEESFSKVDNYAVFLQSTFNYEDSLVLTGGFRHDINSQYEDSTTYKFDAAYRIKQTGTRLRGNYATAFRVPTFNDLFFPPIDFGFGLTEVSNPDLSPEKTKGWEVGVDQSLLDGNLTFGSTYYDSKFTNLIQFDFVTFLPMNLARATSRGIESYFHYNFENSSISVSHAWNEALDAEKIQLQKRARHKLSANLRHSWDKLQATVGVTFKTGVNEGGGKTDTYKTVRAVLEYQALKNLKITARGENIFNENYQESISFFGHKSFGYGTAGISGYLGFVISSD